MSGYFSFQKYITSYFVKVIYIIGFLAVTAAGIGLVIWSATRLQAGSLPTRLGWNYIAAGAGILLVGNLVWRIFCELWVVLFNIHDRLVSLDRKFGGETAAATTEVTRVNITKDVEHEKPQAREDREVIPQTASVLGLS